MTKIKDGGPVFPQSPGDPTTSRHSYASVYGGMALRDHFAGQLAAALVVNVFDTAKQADKSLADGIDMVTVLSYAVADAMLKAREADPS